MPRYDIRQDKPYRRGLVLGLTMAEIMILLLFLLLMAHASALASREKRLEALDNGGASKLVETIQEAYPQAKDPDDYFKELVKAIEARKIVEERSTGSTSSPDQMIEDAAIASEARKAAQQAGSQDPLSFANKAFEKAKAGKKGEWPPFLSLSEAGGYYFESGKATLRPEFRAKLRSTIIPILRKNVDDYGVDVIEVTGHTDEVPMVGASNLDKNLIAVSANRLPVEALQSTDNAGLAIARAVAVVKLLRADPRMNGITILPLSGAQLIVPNDRPADGSQSSSDQLRRRIEIRLRRTTEQVAPAG